MAIWIPVHNQSSNTHCNSNFATSNETFSVSQTPSLSSSKVEDIDEESSKRKESISGNHIKCKYTFSDKMFCPNCLSAVH